MIDCGVRVQVLNGKWYYEATLLTEGVMQIGWASDACAPNPDPDVGKGVGRPACFAAHVCSVVECFCLHVIRDCPAL